MLRRLSRLLLFSIALALSPVALGEQNFTLEEGESLPRSAASTEAHSQIESVLASDDFAREKIVTRWRLKNWQDKDNRDESFPEWFIKAVEFFERSDRFFSGLATILEVLLWLLVAAVIIFVLQRYRSQIGDFISGLGQHEPEPELPTTLFGLDVKKTSLPKNVIESAQQLWRGGESRQGIALLLRASLIKLLHEHGCRFMDSDTESECCERINSQLAGKVSDYMWQLVSSWQQVAYAHNVPSDHEFDQLCAGWEEVF